MRHRTTTLDDVADAESQPVTGLTVETSRPSTVRVPDVGSIIRLIIRIGWSCAAGRSDEHRERSVGTSR